MLNFLIQISNACHGCLNRLRTIDNCRVGNTFIWFGLEPPFYMIWSKYYFTWLGEYYNTWLGVLELRRGVVGAELFLESATELVGLHG